MIAALLASRRAGRDGVISDRRAPDSRIQRDLSDFGNMLSIIIPIRLRTLRVNQPS